MCRDIQSVEIFIQEPKLCLGQIKWLQQYTLWLFMSQCRLMQQSLVEYYYLVWIYFVLVLYNIIVTVLSGIM